MAFVAFAMPLVEHNRHPQRRPNFCSENRGTGAPQRPCWWWFGLAGQSGPGQSCLFLFGFSNVDDSFSLLDRRLLSSASERQDAEFVDGVEPKLRLVPAVLDNPHFAAFILETKCVAHKPIPNVE